MASGSDNAKDLSDGSRQRQPRTLEGVLQMAIENLPEGQNPNPSQPPLDQERVDFLNKVFAEIHRDETKEMISLSQTVAKKMDSENEEDEEEVENCLEALGDLCDSFDKAQDFHKIGATQLLPRLMEHPRSEVRWRTFELIATIVQHVPLNQKVLLDMGGVEKLLEAVDKDSSNLARVKALYALSCLARENEDCLRVFEDKDGFSVLMRAMQSNVEKLQIKAAFMLQALLQRPNNLRDTLHDMGMVHQLVGLLQTDHTATHEHFMAALLNLVSGHPSCVEDCRQPNLRLRQFLTARQALIKDKPEFQEENSYCQQLMKICFSSNHGNSSTVDR